MIEENSHLPQLSHFQCSVLSLMQTTFGIRPTPFRIYFTDHYPKFGLTQAQASIQIDELRKLKYIRYLDLYVPLCSLFTPDAYLTTSEFRALSKFIAQNPINMENHHTQNTKQNTSQNQNQKPLNIEIGTQNQIQIRIKTEESK